MVAEHGWKVRGVTKQPARYLAVGSAYRRALYPVLTRRAHVSTGEAILDPELTEIRFWHRAGSGFKVFSADFSDATTSLSHEVLRTFGEAFGVPLELLFKGHRVMGKPVTTGCPMGMPMSWTALSIIHYCIASIVDDMCNFRIKGDDLIASWTAEQITEYKVISAQVGLVVNEKTWVHDELGTFCEGDYKLSHERGSKWFILRRLPTFSLKSFVKDEPVPYEIGERYISRGVDRQLLRDMQGFFHESWITLARAKGVNVYAPSCFGGLGFIPKLDHPLDEVTARVVNASHNGTLIYDQRQVIHTSLARRCLDQYALCRWSVNGPGDTAQLERRFATALAASCYVDAYSGSCMKGTITRGKRVRSLAAYRKKFLRSGINTVFVRTSVQTAYSVSSRLRPEEPPAPAPYVNIWA
jgi:hypothetical protein